MPAVLKPFRYPSSEMTRYPPSLPLSSEPELLPSQSAVWPAAPFLLGWERRREAGFPETESALGPYFLPTCIYAICKYAIYVPTNCSTPSFLIGMQIGILSFFSVTSITSTGIFVQNKKKKKREKIDFCGLHDRHDIKVMSILACVVIVCSSSEQCTQSVFAFAII